MNLLEPPPQFFCPITKGIMLNPYIARDGYSYEKVAIVEWLKEYSRSPVTNLEITGDIVSNLYLKQLIINWNEVNNVKEDHYCSFCCDKFISITKCDCDQRFYCSNTCQKKYWNKGHKHECSSMNKYTDNYKKDNEKQCFHSHIHINKNNFDEVEFTCLDCGLHEWHIGILSNIYFHRRKLKKIYNCKHSYIDYKKLVVNKDSIDEYTCLNCGLIHIDEGQLVDLYKNYKKKNNTV